MYNINNFKIILHLPQSYPLLHEICFPLICDVLHNIDMHELLFHNIHAK